MKSWAGSVIGVAVLLNGCGSHDASTLVHASQCMPVSGATPAKVRATAPADGVLRALVRPDGVSIIATLDHERARSPIDRYGSVTLVRSVRAGETVTLTAESRDSPEIVGEACLSMELLRPGDTARLRAEQAFAAAARSVAAGDASRALNLYLDAAREFDDFDRVRAAEARHAMAEIAYVPLAREDDAFWLARSALADYAYHGAPGPPPGLMSSLLALEARTLLELERFTASERRTRVLDLLEQSRKWARADRFGGREQPRIDILRGFMDYRAGSNPQASAWFEKAAGQCEQLKDWECYARALQNHAALAEEARNYTVALRAFANVLRVLPPDLDRQLTADIWGNQGTVQVAARLFDQAEHSHRVSIRLHAEIGDCPGVRVGVSRLGSLLVQVGSLADGVSALSEATSLECPALLAAAKSGFDETTVRNAAPCTTALQADTLDASSKYATFNALIGLRDALESEDRTKEARHCLRSAAPYAGTARTRLRLANTQADALIKQGKPKQAITMFDQALANADRDGIPPTHESRAAAYLGLAQAALLEGKPLEAREHAHRSLLLGSSRADIGQIVDSLQLLAQTFTGPAESDEALGILHTAAALVEQVPIDGLDAEKRATWLASQHAVFAEMTRLFATGAANDEERAWQAFEASERGRARSLRYAMNQMPGGEGDSGASDAPRFQQVMQRISELAGSQSAEAPQISLEALAEIARQGEATGDTASRTLLKGQLAALDAAAIEYAVGRDDMYAFVIDGAGISVTRLGKTRDIGVAAENLYDKIHNRESAYSDVRRAAAKLAQLVLWPISAKLTHRRVMIVPDDSLHTVPFSVLPWSADADAPLLLERSELSVVPSTLFVTHPRLAARYSGSPRLELIGDPVFQASRWQRECAAEESARAQPVALNRRSMPDLPGSRQEVLAIERLAQRAPTSIRVSKQLGCKATPSALRAAASAGPDLLHIATHGDVDAYRPRLSALALTQDSPGNGGASTVGLLDILNMHVGSRLVVLSACDTSRGRLLPGEGVLGPAQAFLQAGAATVVASYWRIPDEHTAPFMETFYRYLLVDRLSAAAALRRAQLDYAKDRASFDWAAFTLYGWPDTTL